MRTQRILILQAAVNVIGLAFAIGCQSPEAKRSEAASSYAAQQADCIANNQSREAIDACRDKVKAAWGSDASTDGGAK